MEFMIDTTDLATIEKYINTFPIAGVTSTPSIIKREGKIDFFTHMQKTLAMIGNKRTLHMQVVAKDTQGMIADAEAIWKNISNKVYVKIPTTIEGLRAVKYLKDQQECKITSSAIYTKLQGALAVEAGVDYIAIYCNRIENVDIDYTAIISHLRNLIDRSGSKTKILASSIKNVAQINFALEYGADAVTFHPSILATAFEMASIHKAVDDFSADWFDLYATNNI